MDVIQVILLAVVTFIFAIDQFSLTETLYRPMVACPIIGLCLGDLNTGLVVGGTYELMMVGNMPVGGAQPPNAVLGAVVAMVFAVKSGMGVEAALGSSIIFAVFGQYVVTTVFTIMSGLMSKADKAAEEANPAGITQVTVVSMGLLGALFAVLAILAYTGGTQAAEMLNEVQESASWIMGGLSAAGGMMRFVGFAILMKIMLSSDLWGFFLAGFAMANIISNIEVLANSTMILMAFIGFAIALFDFQVNVNIKNRVGSGTGGTSDGI
ncbi:PTS system N-acetylgalactosamine-specific IIC component [Breznakia sp. PF5-3]|nr:PTS system N-acetylgalactosamine-specific IIC component [Breznakia sp. PM6-1]MDF9836341.1 PTS system N-acetylgalactosamine-specific IIC component [Breznakia sp. PF5-3]MDF9838189.1 PTS system N-acetylgalactosamine-specific IIC component [Breznakia sp. PFB2-8]MDF9860218.1 PTS system N-acetylgalactosamine-specific IIC component [Breznakia sp. PH5-24]